MQAKTKIEVGLAFEPVDVGAGFRGGEMAEVAVEVEALGIFAFGVSWFVKGQTLIPAIKDPR